MNSQKSYRRKKENKSLLGTFFSRIKKSYHWFIFSNRSKPKEYRPFLGNTDTTEGKSLDSSFKDEIKRSKSHRKRRYKRKNENAVAKRIKKYRRKLSLSKEEKQKRKYKKKIKQKHRKEFKRQERINLIRKFFPQYKRKKDLAFDELSPDEASEYIKQQQKNYFHYTINSVVLFIFAYLIVYFIYQLTVLITASRWGLDSVLFYYNLAFNDYSPLWSRRNIILVTGSGPFISFLIGFIFYKLIANRPKLRGFTKLFVLWIALHGFNMFFGAWASGVSFDKGFGYVPAWLYLNVFMQILVSLIFLFILGTISYYSASKFLDTSNSLHRVKPENKTKFLLHQVVLPWIIGITIIFLIKIPNNMPYDTGNLITMLFAIVPVLFNRYAHPTVLFNKERRPSNIRWFYIAVLIIILLAYRLGLNDGLHVMLKYSFDISLDIKPL